MRVKPIFSRIAICFVFFIFSSCKSGKSNNDSEKLRSEDWVAGYVIGVDIGSRLKNQPLSIMLSGVLQGISDTYYEKKLVIPSDSIRKIQVALHAKGEAIETEMTERRDRGNQFLDSNKVITGIHLLPTGTQYRIESPGYGNLLPTDSDSVVINISGAVLDGTVFENTWKTKEPKRIMVKGAIAGIRELLKVMKKGEKVKAWVPSNAGFGREGIKNVIPPYALLIYDIEVLEIKKNIEK